MSQWYEVKDEDDVDLSDDKKFVQILFDTDQFGNCYVEVPVEILVKLLEPLSRNGLEDIEREPLCWNIKTF